MRHLGAAGPLCDTGRWDILNPLSSSVYAHTVPSRLVHGLYQFERRLLLVCAELCAFIWSLINDVGLGAHEHGGCHHLRP